jgi:biopolymer transport protein ExbD
MGVTVGQEVEQEDEVIVAINTTPLVDVMMVLLIIFLITIPVVIQQVPLELPKERNQPNETKPENIVIAVNKDGDVFWNQELVPDTKALLERLKKVAVLTRVMNPWAGSSRPARGRQSSRSASSPNRRLAGSSTSYKGIRKWACQLAVVGTRIRRR